MFGEQAPAMGSEKGKADFFVSTAAAKLAISKLTSKKVHPHFSGYLAAVAAATEAGRQDNLKINFQEFYSNYLLVAGAPPTKPYLQPFSESAKEAPQLFNKNVAGSYAPSSLRSVAPIRAVVDFHGSRQRVTHTLKANHETIAVKELTGSKRIPVHSLATFLFRDHKIHRIGASDADSAMKMFCRIFGYDLSIPTVRVQFETLYEPDEETFASIVFAEA